MRYGRRTTSEFYLAGSEELPPRFYVFHPHGIVLLTRTSKKYDLCMTLSGKTPSL
jgi:hypothetical protein